MSFMAQMMIAYEMFKEFMKTTFGGGVHFDTLCPGYSNVGYAK